MGISLRKTVVAAVAALGMAAAVATISTPAEAQWRHGGGGWGGGGWHGGWGGGGWHGGGGGGGWRGGWGGGGWRGGWGGGGWGWRRAGWGWGGGWGGGCWNCGWGWGWDPGWAVAAAVPIGVAIAANSQPVYADNGCWVRRRIWDARGRYLGRRLVNVCY